MRKAVLGGTAAGAVLSVAIVGGAAIQGLAVPPAFAQGGGLGWSASRGGLSEDQMICNSYAAEYRTEKERFDSSWPEMQAAVEQYNASLPALDSARQSFRAARESGDVTQSRRLLPQVDAVWTRAGRENERLVSALTAAAGAGRAMCAAVSQSAARGCLQSDAHLRCASESGLDSIEKALGEAQSRSEPYTRSWRSAADENFVRTGQASGAGANANAGANPDAEAKRLQCSAQGETYRAVRQRFLGAEPDVKAAANQYNQSIGEFNTSRRAFRAARDAGDTEAALGLSTQVDSIWTKLRGQNERLVSTRVAAVDAGRAMCTAMTQLVENGCIKTDLHLRCASASGLDGYETGLGQARGRTAEYAGTWRNADDEKFMTVAQSCPMNAAAVAPRATITEATGRVFIQRGVRAMRAAVGTELLIGDVVVVEEGSAASLNLFGGGLLKISEKTKFEIPNPVTAPPPPGILAQAWRDIVQAYKEHAEAYEYGKMIKVPTATCGVRG